MSFASAEFPLIPLPIKEAVLKEGETLQDVKAEFPLIPLPIKEAVICLTISYTVAQKFPLIPLPIKEAVRD